MLYVTAHPSGTRKRREKGRGKEPEVLRGETHPAAPWSCLAAGLPRGITLWRVPAPDGWAPWAALLALVLIKQIKQRHSSPGPRGSAAPGNPRRLRGMPVPLLSQPGGLKNGLDGAKTQREAHGGVREVLPVTRSWDGAQGTVPHRGDRPSHEGPVAAPSPGSSPGCTQHLAPCPHPYPRDPSEGDTGSGQGGPGEEREPWGRQGEAGNGFWEG